MLSALGLFVVGVLTDEIQTRNVRSLSNIRGTPPLGADCVDFTTLLLNIVEAADLVVAYHFYHGLSNYLLLCFV